MKPEQLERDEEKGKSNKQKRYQSENLLSYHRSGVSCVRNVHRCNIARVAGENRVRYILIYFFKTHVEEVMLFANFPPSLLARTFKFMRKTHTWSFGCKCAERYHGLATMPLLLWLRMGDWSGRRAPASTMLARCYGLGEHINIPRERRLC